MRTKFITWCAAASTLVVGLIRWTDDEAHDKRAQDRSERATEVTWHTDVQAAEKLAASTGKPLLLIFR